MSHHIIRMCSVNIFLVDITMIVIQQHVGCAGINYALRVILAVSLAVHSLQKWTKLSKSGEEPWPEERSYHAACCLNYGQKHPQLLVIGGENKDATETLRDVWILDVASWKWRKVRRKCVHSVMVMHSCHPSLLWLDSFAFTTVLSCFFDCITLPVPKTILWNYHVLQ